MKRKVATPAELARGEDPGANAVSEAAEVVPAESVHLKRNEKLQKPIDKPKTHPTHWMGFFFFHYRR